MVQLQRDAAESQTSCVYFFVIMSILNVIIRHLKNELISDVISVQLNLACADKFDLLSLIFLRGIFSMVSDIL